jgi:hypothetical protein
VKVVDADDLVSPCFLESKNDMRAYHVVWSVTLTSEKGVLTDVTGPAGDEDALSKKGELWYGGGKTRRTLRVCCSVEGM